MSKTLIRSAAAALTVMILMCGCSGGKDDSSDTKAEKAQIESSAENEKTAKPVTTDITDKAETGIVSGCTVENENAGDFSFLIRTEDSADAFEDLFGDGIVKLCKDTDFEEYTILVKSFSTQGGACKIKSVTTCGNTANIDVEISAGDSESSVYNYAYAVVANEYLPDDLNGWFAPDKTDFTDRKAYCVNGQLSLESYEVASFEQLIAEFNAYSTQVFFDSNNNEIITFQIDSASTEASVMAERLTKELGASECSESDYDINCYAYEMLTIPQKLVTELSCNVSGEGEEDKLSEAKTALEDSVGESGWLSAEDGKLSGGYYKSGFSADKFTEIVGKFKEETEKNDKLIYTVSLGYIQE